MKAKANSVLEKKLEELESLLEAITFNNDDPNVYRKLVLGVLFAKTLLAAEISSRPMDVEGEEDVEEMFKLRCMATRLTEIGDIITNKFPGYDNGALVEPEIGCLETNAGIVNSETGSIYSLVESCMNESTKAEEEEEEREAEAEQLPLFQEATPEEKSTFPAMAAEAVEVVVDREVEMKGWVRFKAVVCFGLIGLIGGLISLFGYIGDNSMKNDHHSFVTPT